MQVVCLELGGCSFQLPGSLIFRMYCQLAYEVFGNCNSKITRLEFFVEVLERLEPCSGKLARLVDFWGAIPGGYLTLLPLDFPTALILVGSEKAFTVKVDQMRWRVGNPDFGFPGNVIQVFQHSPSINKSSHENQTSGN